MGNVPEWSGARRWARCGRPGSLRLQSVCNVLGYCRLITPLCDGRASRIGSHLSSPVVVPVMPVWMLWPNGDLTRSNHALQAQ